MEYYRFHYTIQNLKEILEEKTKANQAQSQSTDANAHMNNLKKQSGSWLPKFNLPKLSLPKLK